MTLEQAQQALEQLLLGGAFHFSTDLATITYEEREELLHAIDPQPYELAYQLGPINYLEKLSIDYNGSVVEMLRTETTWQYNKLRAFELEITEVPKLIVVLNEAQEEPKVLTTTWWCNQQGAVVAYLSSYNGVELEKLGFDDGR